MSKATGWINSVFALHCPRCRTGNLFLKPLTFRSAYAMHDACTHCHQKYEPEPGFYYGAMFISYIFSGMLWLSIVLTLVFAFHWSVEAAMALVIALALISHVYFYRLSRSIWIHMIVKYDPIRGMKERL